MTNESIKELVQLAKDTERVNTLLTVYDLLKKEHNIDPALVKAILDLGPGKPGNPAPITDDARLNELLR